MTAKEYIKVIKACRSLGVEKFRSKGLEIQFFPGGAVKLEVKTGDAAKPPTDRELKDIEGIVQDDQIRSETENEIEHMAVENPALFEQLLVERVLEERGEPDGEDYSQD